MLKIQQIISSLPQLLQDKPDTAVSNYKNHFHQMDYSETHEKHYPIGSGVTEAACKKLTKQSLRFSGICWKQKYTSTILSLRSLVLTAQRWIRYWQKIDLLGPTNNILLNLRAVGFLL